MIVHLLCSFVPVDRAHGFIQHGCKRYKTFILRCSNRRTVLKFSQCFTKQFCAKVSQPVQQFSGSFIGTDHRFGYVDHISRIHLVYHILRRYAGFLLSVQNCPLVRGGAAVLGQQAGMDIDRALAGNIQHGLRQNPSVGHNCQYIRLQLPQLFNRLLFPEILRLVHRNFVGQRNLLDGRKDHLHPPSFGPVRLSIHTDDLISVS